MTVIHRCVHCLGSGRVKVEIKQRLPNGKLNKVLVEKNCVCRGLCTLCKQYPLMPGKTDLCRGCWRELHADGRGGI